MLLVPSCPPGLFVLERLTFPFPTIADATQQEIANEARTEVEFDAASATAPPGHFTSVVVPGVLRILIRKHPLMVSESHLAARPPSGAAAARLPFEPLEFDEHRRGPGRPVALRLRVSPGLPFSQSPWREGVARSAA